MRTRIRQAVLTMFASLSLLVGLAGPANAADYVVSYVPNANYAYTYTQSYSGSCYLGNGVNWKFTARWSFGSTSPTNVNVRTVQFTYYTSGGGGIGGAWVSNGPGATVWESGYNNRGVAAGQSYSQTFTINKNVQQSSNGVRFNIGTRPSNCGGATINAHFYIRASADPR